MSIDTSAFRCHLDFENPFINEGDENGFTEQGHFDHFGSLTGYPLQLEVQTLCSMHS